MTQADELALPASRSHRPGSPSFDFVLGTGRCGSTLVHEILARHPEVGFVSNIEDRFPVPAWVGQWNPQLYERIPPSWTRKGRVRFAPSEGYRLLDRTVSPMLRNPFRDLTEADVTEWLHSRLFGVFARRATVQGQPVFLHKFTGWPRARFLHAVFAEARFIHIVRDGRAVANSWLQMPWWNGHEGPERWPWGPLTPEYEECWERSGRSFVVLAGLAWRLLIDAFDEARAGVADGSWLELRYEDVLAQPEASFEDMLDFLGLEFGARFERQLARYDLTTERREAFRRDLDPDSLRQLTAVVEEPLLRLGYRL